MRIGLNTPQNFFAMLARRKWWVGVPFVALFCALGILIYYLPMAYVSETLILVQPRDIPNDFVKDLIAGSTEERLNAIEQTVLSRTNLLQILREFDASLPEFRDLDLEDKVLKIRSQINIAFELQKKNGVELPLTYFRISFQNQNPEVAQKITRKLTSLFIEQDQKTRETEVFGTREFFTSELEKVSTQLQESDEKLKQVRSAHQFELPAQLDANSRSLDRYTTEKRTNAEALDRYATFRMNLESQIAETPEVIPRVVAPVPAAAMDPLVEDYRKAKLEFADLSSRYTAKHPEVLAAKAHMEGLKAKLSPEALAVVDSPQASAATSATMPNPLYISLTNQLRDVNTELEIRQKARAQIESEIVKYNQRVDNTPRTEQDMVEMLRQNADLQKQHDDLKAKLSQAQLSESLESKQKGAQFLVVDDANYPLKATKPNKIEVLLAGVVISLLISIAFAATVDVVRQRVWMQSEIEAFWGVPVLVEIPEIITDSDLALLRQQKVSRWASSAVAAVAYSFCLYVLYMKHNYIFQTLDPVLQRIYK